MVSEEPGRAGRPRPAGPAAPAESIPAASVPPAETPPEDGGGAATGIAPQPARPAADEPTGAATPAAVNTPAATGSSASDRGSVAPAVRASDAERHEVAELLGEHASLGRLTLAELEERVEVAYQATTRAELAELTRDLPPLAEGSTLAPTRRVSRWFVSVMSGSTWRGRRRLAGAVTMVAVMGGDDLDLREAEIDGNELVITIFTLMGGNAIYVPDSVEVELSGPAIMGSHEERGSTRRPRAGAPLIRIRAFTLMGSVEVWRLPAEARGGDLKSARRLAKAIERGTA